MIRLDYEAYPYIEELRSMTTLGVAGLLLPDILPPCGGLFTWGVRFLFHHWRDFFIVVYVFPQIRRGLTILSPERYLVSTNTGVTMILRTRSGSRITLSNCPMLPF